MSFPLEERDEAAEQLEQLAEDGDAYAQYIIGTAYRDGGLLIPDTTKAQKLLERAAEQDLDAAQYALGKLYLSDDADVHNPAEGIYWLKRSADRSRPPSCWPPPDYSTTWAISFGTMHQSPLPTAFKSTASGWRSCGKSASPSATSRMITSRSSNRDFQ